MADYVSDLLKVSHLKNDIKNQFTAKKLHDQGLERDLTQIYKPLTESQTKNTTNIIAHLSNISNENNKKLIDFKDTFKNFPDLIASINDVKSLLDIKTTEIINKLKTKDPSVVDEIQELDQEHKLFEDALSEISETDTGIDTLDTLSGVAKAKEYVHKEATAREIIKKEDSASKTVYENVLRLSTEKSAEHLKTYLADEAHANSLLRFVEQNPTINLNSNPWRKINTVDPEFYKHLKTAKTAKKGTGLVKFLPCDKTDLVTELFRLLGSYKSGNKNVYNELNAVVDQLRRNGVLSIKQSKQIYKTIS